MWLFDFISNAWDTVKDVASNVWEALTDLFSSPSDLPSGPSGSYDDNAEQANNHLAETRKAMAEYAANAEEKLIDAIMERHKKTIDALRTIMQKKGLDKKLAIDFDELQKKSNELTESVKGNLGRFYNDHLVATNGEVKGILEETNYDKRQKKLDSYCESLHKKALDNLKKRIKQAIDEQTELLNLKVNNAIAAIGNDMVKQKKTLDDLLKEKQGKETESHKTQMQQIYVHGICEILGTQLEVAQSLH